MQLKFKKTLTSLLILTPLVITPVILLSNSTLLNDVTISATNSIKSSSSYVLDETIVDAWTVVDTTIVKTTNGDVYSWGNNTSGQTGLGGTTNVVTPTLLLDASEPSNSKGNFTFLSPNETIIDAWTMNDTLIAKTTNGDVFSWGWNIFAQTGLGSSEDNILAPTILLDTSDPTQSKGDFASLEADETIIDAWTMGYTVVAKTTNGNVYSWGYGEIGSTGLGGTNNVSTPTLLLDASEPSNSKGGFKNLSINDTIFDAWVMNDTIIAKTTNDDVYSWGYNYYNETAIGGIANIITPTLLLDASTPGNSKGAFTSLSSNETITDAWTINHTIISKTTSGDIFSWGKNDLGQTGIGITTDIPTLLLDPSNPIYSRGDFATLPINETITDMWAIGEAMIAKSTNNNLYSWGHNKQGQTGLGGTTNISIPTLLLNASMPGSSKGEFTNLSVDETIIDAWTMDNTIIAKTTSEDIFSWGYNQYGQTGLGGTTNVVTPTLLLDASTPSNSKGSFTSLLENETIIYAWTEDNTAFSKTTNGDIFSWGYNQYGQTGFGGTTNNVFTPTILYDAPIRTTDPVVPVVPKDPVDPVVPVTPEVPSTSSGGMSTGALVGIIIGSIAGVAVIGFGIWWYIKKIK